MQIKPLGIMGAGVASGAHLCAFYRTRQDFYELCSSFIQAGLQGHEYCMWITAGRMLEAAALASLGNVVSDPEQYVGSGQLEIVPHSEWYLQDRTFDRHIVLERWKANETRAEKAGYQGMRVVADLAWLHAPADWDQFSVYEQEVNASLRKSHIIGLCAYSTAQINVERMCTMLQCHTHSVRERGAHGWTVAQVQ